jgi:hypothetical protein
MCHDTGSMRGRPGAEVKAQFVIKRTNGLGLWSSSLSPECVRPCREGRLACRGTLPARDRQRPGAGADGNSPYTKALAQTIKRRSPGIFDAFIEVRP